MTKIFFILSICCAFLLFSYTKKHEVALDETENVYPPMLIYQDEIYITSPLPPNDYELDRNQLELVGTIKSSTPPTDTPKEDFQSNFGMIGEEIYTTTDYLDYILS